MKKLLILSVICLFGCKKNEIAPTNTNNTNKDIHTLTVGCTYGGYLFINDIEQPSANTTYQVRKGDRIVVSHNGNALPGGGLDNIIVFVHIDGKGVYERICNCTAYFYTEIQ